MWSPVRELRRNPRDTSRIKLLLEIATILIILWCIILAIAQREKMNIEPMHTPERGAIAALKTIYTVQIQYRSQFGHYAASLAQLGPPTGAGSHEGARAANLLSAHLATGSTGGYHITVTQTPTGYAALAMPQIFDKVKRRSFYTDQSGVIRESTMQEPATAQSPEVK
jgi:hypothetical protein